MAAAAAIAGMGLPAQAANWSVDGNGIWSNSANWGGSPPPNAVDETATFTLDVTGDRIVTMDVSATLGQLYFADADVNSAGGWTIVGPGGLTLEGSSAPVITVDPFAAGKSARIDAVLAGTQGFSKVGTGVLELGGANTVSGTVNTSAGVVRVVSGGSLTIGALNVSAGAQFQLQGGSISSNALSTINGNAGQFIMDSGTANFSAGLRTNNTDSATIRVNGGTLTASDITVQRNSAGTPSFTSGFIVTGGTVNAGTMNFGTNNSNGAMSIEGGNVTATGAVTIGRQATGGRGGAMRVLSGTFTSTDTVDGVVLSRVATGGNANNVASATFTGGTSTVEKFKMGYDSAVTAGSATLTVNGGTLFIGSGGIEMNGTGTFNANVNLTSGTLGAKDDWTGVANVTLPASNSITIQAADAANVARNVTFAGVVSGAGTFTKTGGGTLELTGANTWTGGATVNAGTLAGRAASLRGNIVNNASVSFTDSATSTFTGAISGAGSVTKSGPGTSVLANPQTYTGATTINQGVLSLVGTQATSGVTVNNGGGLSTANGNATVNALTLGSSGGDAMSLIVNGGSGINQLTVINSGGLVANGTTTVDVGSVGLTAGSHVLVDYAGSIGGAGFGAFSLGALPPRVTANLVHNLGNTSIDLNVTGVDFPRWMGSTNGDWDVNTTQNWREVTSGNLTTYLENSVPGDQVVFDDAATGTTNVNLTTTLQPSLVTVNNQSKTYTFAGPGKISGPTELIKQNVGTLILSNVGNDHTGGTTVQAGTLQLATPGTLLPDRTVTVAGGTLDLAGQTHEFSGTLRVQGGTISNGTIDKTGSNYDLRSGTVSASMGGTAGVTKTGAGTAVILGTNHTFTGPVVVTEGTLQFGDGVTNGSVPGAGMFLGDQRNITNNGTVRFNNGSDQVYTGSILGFDGTVIKDGAGTLTLYGVNAASGNEGNAIVNEGTVVLVGTPDSVNPTHARLGRGGTINVNNGATVRTEQFNGLGLNSGFNPPRVIINTGGTLTSASDAFTSIYNITLAGGEWTSPPEASWDLRGEVDVTAPNSAITIPLINIFNVPTFTVDSGASIEVTSTLAGTSGVQKAGPGTMTLSGENTYTGGTDVTGGRLIIAGSHVNSAALTVSNDGVAELASDGSHLRVIRTPTVSAAGSGKIDLKDNKMIVTTADAIGSWDGSAYTGVTGLIQSGRNEGTWDGTGIVTSMPPATTDYTTLGVATASDVLGIGPTDQETWAGQIVTGTDTLVTYTYGGDANLDGVINIDDYGQIDFNVGLSGVVFGYFNGDFNLDGLINIDDYGIIDFNIGIQGPPIPTAGGAGGAALSGVAAVPEPGSLAWFGVAAAGLLRRRRRERLQ